MKISKKIRVAAIAAFISSAVTPAVAQEQFIPANDPLYTYMGRISYDDDGIPSWTYPGVQIQTVFTGTSVAMRTNEDSGFYVVQIDDDEPFKVECGKKEERTQLASNLADTRHRLTITYAIEGHAKKPKFYGLYLDDGAALVEKPQLPERKIEFIGNSITCGYGNEGNGKEKTFYYRCQNFCKTYAAITAQRLNAQYHVVARSGIGVYRNYMGKIPDQLMKFIYPHTKYSTKGELWDFSKYQPHLVCLALGTNDTTGSYSADGLADAFVLFVRTLRDYYPEARIVMLIGPMMSEKRRADLRRAHQAVIDDGKERGDNAIFSFEFSESDKAMGMGSQGHPNVAHHQVMADELTPYLQQLMNW